MVTVFAGPALVPQFYNVQTPQWGMYPQNTGLLQQTLPQGQTAGPQGQGQVLRGQTPRSLTPSQQSEPGLGTPTGSVQPQLYTPGECAGDVTDVMFFRFFTLFTAPLDMCC